MPTIHLRLLLEKLYAHKLNLETMMHVEQQHCCSAATALFDQYTACLLNIKKYESFLNTATNDAGNMICHY